MGAGGGPASEEMEPRVRFKLTTRAVPAQPELAPEP